MLTCPTHLPIYFCTEPVDFRKSFDGLTGVITLVFGRSVLDGHLFLFINKRRDRIKAMWWDRDGTVIACKRLEQGTFEMPRGCDSSSDRDSLSGRDSSSSGDEPGHVTLDATQLSMLLGGVALSAAKRRRKRLIITR
jgi:transposase